MQRREPALTAGELNYQIFYYVKHTSDLGLLEVDIKSFVAEFLGDKPNYQRYNDMAGVLTLCRKEIKRRLNTDLKDLFNSVIDSYDDEIVKFEEQKIQENSDVE